MLEHIRASQRRHDLVAFAAETVHRPRIDVIQETEGPSKPKSLQQRLVRRAEDIHIWPSVTFRAVIFGTGGQIWKPLVPKYCEKLKVNSIWGLQADRTGHKVCTSILLDPIVISPPFRDAACTCKHPCACKTTSAGISAHASRGVGSHAVFSLPAVLTLRMMLMRQVYVKISPYLSLMRAPSGRKLQHTCMLCMVLL